MDNDPLDGLDNEDRAYVGLHESMMAMYHAHDFKGSLRLAAQLLTRANIPYLIRARCHMVLSTKINSVMAVSHAEAAVEFLDVEVRNLVQPEEFPTGQLELARGLLERAKAREVAEASDRTALPAIAEAAKSRSSSPNKHGLATSSVSRTVSVQDHASPEDQRAETAIILATSKSNRDGKEEVGR